MSYKSRSTVRKRAHRRIAKKRREATINRGKPYWKWSTPRVQPWLRRQL